MSKLFQLFGFQYSLPSIMDWSQDVMINRIIWEPKLSTTTLEVKFSYYRLDIVLISDSN